MHIFHDFSSDSPSTRVPIANPRSGGLPRALPLSAIAAAAFGIAALATPSLPAHAGDGFDEHGTAVPAGAYFARLSGPDQGAGVRLVVVR